MNEPIDTLILSGGGPSGIAYIGIFKALHEKGILKKDKSGIKEIITTSVGIVFAILYMLNIKEDICERIILGTDISSILDIENLDIDNLLVDFGLFDNHKIGDSIKSYIKHTLQEEGDLTLKELYEKIPIKLTVKVFNSTKGKIEYISYETDPDLSISLLSQMTTAIPFFFKPIKYNDCLYVDGGLKGHFPIEACKSDNYLGLFVGGNTCNIKESDIIKIFPILEFIKSLMDYKIDDLDNYLKEKIIICEINQGLNFDLSEDRKKIIINLGYDNTIKHIEEYYL